MWHTFPALSFVLPFLTILLHFLGHLFSFGFSFSYLSPAVSPPLQSHCQAPDILPVPAPLPHPCPILFLHLVNFFLFPALFCALPRDSWLPSLPVVPALPPVLGPCPSLLLRLPQVWHLPLLLSRCSPFASLLPGCWQPSHGQHRKDGLCAPGPGRVPESGAAPVGQPWEWKESWAPLSPGWCVLARSVGSHWAATGKVCNVRLCSVRKSLLRDPGCWLSKGLCLPCMCCVLPSDMV